MSIGGGSAIRLLPCRTMPVVRTGTDMLWFMWLGGAALGEKLWAALDMTGRRDTLSSNMAMSAAFGISPGRASKFWLPLPDRLDGDWLLDAGGRSATRAIGPGLSIPRLSSSPGSLCA
jgi:hypothetical protein